ncbi:MAG: pantothenate kinase [Epulopiscium sp. Nele67-Bin005]|nr:MAG: pantothenate kinase [Epulopiscium sp. Nele67-Bin005]
MILVADVGNTNIVMGVMHEDELVTRFKITTQTSYTSDEYGVLILNILEKNGVYVGDITGSIIGSVVPDIMYSLRKAFEKYIKTKPLIVQAGTKTGIAIKCDNPKEVGADRIVNCVAANELYGSPCIVIDFGTATTYDILNSKSEFIAGITSPGIRISADALWKNTAQLPHVEIKITKGILDAKNTITSMQTGLVYGYIGQVEYIINRAKIEMNEPNLKVIATGGLANIIREGTDVIEVYDPILTLKGLNLIYKKNI